MGNKTYCNNALRGVFAQNILSFGEDEAGKENCRFDSKRES